MALTVTLQTPTQGNFTFVLTPYFMPEIVPVMSPNGQRDKTEHRMKLHGTLVGTDAFDQYTALDKIVQENSPLSVLIQDGANVKLRWDKTKFIGSPYLSNLHIMETGAQFVNHLEFEVTVHALLGGQKLDTSNLTADVTRNVSNQIFNNRLSNRIETIVARGPNAEKTIRALRPAGQTPLKEAYFISKDENTFTAEWEFVALQIPKLGIIKWEEQITIQEGKSPIGNTLITGANSVPILRRGRNRPTLVMVVGFIQSYITPINIPFDDGKRLFNEEFLDRTQSELFNSEFLIDTTHGIWQRNYKEFYVLVGVGPKVIPAVPGQAVLNKLPARVVPSDPVKDALPGLGVPIEPTKALAK